jgi:hypothetical protein
MCMPNDHRDAEPASRPCSSKPSAASIVALCRPPNFWDAPNAELDMFSRWIRLSDRALADKQNTRKSSGRRGRRKCKTILFVKPA